jgi:hypothetical protein
MEVIRVIRENTILTARSIGDANCIFQLLVIERKGNFAKIEYDNVIRRTKIYEYPNGTEYLRPDKYSFAPIFKAI